MFQFPEIDELSYILGFFVGYFCYLAERFADWLFEKRKNNKNDGKTL